MSDLYYEMTKTGELIPYIPPLEWNDGVDYDDYVTQLGFSKDDERIGPEHGRSLSWHERSSGEGHKYVASWSDCNRSELIFVPDWPTLVKLQVLASPIIQTDAVCCHLEQIEMVLEKAFRAWHGHNAHDSCMSCDPLQAKREREIQERIAREKANQAKSEKPSQS